MQLIIISGLSGSGKSVVLDTLEDSGYYCIDNLPVPLLKHFIDDVVLRNPDTYVKTAIGIDSRNQGESLVDFGKNLTHIRNQGVICKVLFLHAEDGVLLRRYSETRRRHPLTDDQHSLKAAIAIEKEVLKPVLAHADLKIDTSKSHYHQLRQKVKTLVEDHKPHRLSVQVQSFGFKQGIPMDVDFMFDARCLPNPYWHKELRELTGKDPEVIEFLEKESLVNEYINDLVVYFNKWIPLFAAENRCYLTIAIGCTGGQHRSVFLTEKLAEQIRKLKTNVIIQHRELM